MVGGQVPDADDPLALVGGGGVHIGRGFGVRAADVDHEGILGVVLQTAAVPQVSERRVGEPSVTLCAQGVKTPLVHSLGTSHCGLPSHAICHMTIQ